MQKLWSCNCTWDGIIPMEIAKEWQMFKEQLQQFNEIRIPRWIKMTGASQLQLHAFCDASIKAYAAAIYSRTIDENQRIQVNLLIAKTRVAPIKPVTLPRLELCGAVLLYRLLKQVIEDMKVHKVKCFAWCDSQIVLSWLKRPANQWTTFVANRIGELQENEINCKWNYIPSKENPADHATRGITPSNLLNCEMWWHGPRWLTATEERWQETKLEDFNTILETRGQKATKTMLIIKFGEEVFSRASSWERLLNITAYCLRFIHNCKNPKQREISKLTYRELKMSKIRILKLTQRTSFIEELKRLRQNKEVSKTSAIFKLAPIIDDDGILRVGGRLINSSMPTNRAHPIILPKKGQTTEVLIDYFHRISLHGGPQLVLTTLRIHGFWIINGMHTIKGRLQRCTICARYRRYKQGQLMGNLPSVRITKARPYQNVGIDYAGPITIKMSKHRGSKLYKGYICIIICMAVKAIHLEAVSDLTTEAFIAALRRFMARRGIPAAIYSDNGTNFTGANKYLNKVIQDATSAAEKESRPKGIEWHFIPPYTPHMGGLWEATVRSVKYHLRRTMQSMHNTILPHEELSTLLAQIEACVNSRPLCPNPEDATSLEPLTPGHFIVGTSLLAFPEEEKDQTELSLHNRWKLIQQLRQHFWKRWSTEYILQLQQRQKWCSKKPNLEIGQVVILKDDNLPPQRWKLGRIIQTHLGTDGHARVVTVQTQTDTIKRPIHKLCPLII